MTSNAMHWEEEARSRAIPLRNANSIRARSMGIRWGNGGGMCGAVMVESGGLGGVGSGKVGGGGLGVCEGD